MSYCTYPETSNDKYGKLVRDFLASVGSLTNWSLQDIKAPYTNYTREELQNTQMREHILETISSTLPFRGKKCTRTNTCCGLCTRMCSRRCLQDCFNRIYLWSHTPSTHTTLGVQMLLDNLKDYEQQIANEGLTEEQALGMMENISLQVGEIISRNYNTELRKWMDEEGLKPEDNPNKLDYGPMFEHYSSSSSTDSNTSRRRARSTSTVRKQSRKKVDPNTGRYIVIQWPLSGLCPWFLPRATVHKGALKQIEKGRALD